MMGYEMLVTARNPRRLARVEFIQALREELAARSVFKAENTPETLTAWADARNTLEDRKHAL